MYVCISNVQNVEETKRFVFAFQTAQVKCGREAKYNFVFPNINAKIVRETKCILSCLDISVKCVP